MVEAHAYAYVVSWHKANEITGMNTIAHRKKNDSIGKALDREPLFLKDPSSLMEFIYTAGRTDMVIKLSYT